MELKVGQRVTVLPGVSNRKDMGSLQDSESGANELAFKLGKDVNDPVIQEIKAGGVSRKQHVGKKGGIVEIKDGLALVDDQYVNGPEPKGPCTMREWFLPEELEVG